MLGTGGGFVCPPFGRHARAQRLWQHRCMPPPSSIASTPVRVAVVEDDAACRTALAHALQGASDMRLAWTAARRTEAMAALAQDDAAPLDVLLLDLGPPAAGGMDVLGAPLGRWPP